MDPIRPSAALPPAPRPSAPAAVRPQAGADGPPRGPNPSLRLDPALHLVVMEFHGPDGELRRTMPTEGELEAYRVAQLRGAPQASSVMPRAASSDATGEAPPAPASVARTER